MSGAEREEQIKKLYEREIEAESAAWSSPYLSFL